MNQNRTSNEVTPGKPSKGKMKASGVYDPTALYSYSIQNLPASSDLPLNQSLSSNSSLNQSFQEIKNEPNLIKDHIDIQSV